MKKALIIGFVLLVILIGISSVSDEPDTEISKDNISSSETIDIPDTEETDESEDTEVNASDKTQTTEKITAEASTTKKVTTSKAVSYGGMEITMLDVQQGLSILVEADNEYMIYDGGGRSRSSYVVSYLKQHDVNNLKYMFVSHYDEDHIAGLVGILNTTSVKTVVDPDYSADTKIYNSLKSMISSKGIKEIHPAAGDTFSVGKADITVISSDYYYDDENSRSVCIKIDYGTFSCIISGDAEADAESDIVFSGRDIDCDLYVAGHHGSASSSSYDFVRKMSPAYAFISCGLDNSYGHPAERTLNTLRNNNVQIFRSDIQGEVTCYVTGKTYSFSEDPCNNYTPGSEMVAKTTKKQTTVPDRVIADGGADYVLNNNTKKFHYPYCNSVNQMKEKNKEYYHGSRDVLIAEGYSPCGNCRP